MSHSAFWKNAHHYFERVYDTMGLDPIWRDYLTHPKRVMTVSCPIRLDNGHIQTFTGFRALSLIAHWRHCSKAASASTWASISTRSWRWR